MSAGKAPAHLTELRRLAEETADGLRGWWEWDELSEGCPLPVAVAKYVAALPPDVVLALVDAVRACRVAVFTSCCDTDICVDGNCCAGERCVRLVAMDALGPFAIDSPAPDGSVSGAPGGGVGEETP